MEWPMLQNQSSAERPNTPLEFARKIKCKHMEMQNVSGEIKNHTKAACGQTSDGGAVRYLFCGLRIAMPKIIIQKT